MSVEMTQADDGQGNIKTMLQLNQPATGDVAVMSMTVASEEFDPSHCPTCGLKIASVELTASAQEPRARTAEAIPCGHHLESCTVRATWLE